MFNRNFAETAVGSWQAANEIDPFFMIKAAAFDLNLHPGNISLWADIMNMLDEVRAEQFGG